MKFERYQQFVTVRAEASEIFTEDLNRAVYDLRGKNPVVHFSETDPLCAYVSYTERYQSPESLSDEYELQGVKFTCEMCPMFSPIRTYLKIEMKKRGFEYEPFDRHQIIVYDKDGRRSWDVVCQRGSYGAERGFLEGMGEIFNEVEGHLTATEIIQRIEIQTRRI